MRIPLSWLREYVPVQVPTDELAERLALSTLEVDRVLRLGVPDEDGNLGLYRVGLVVEAGKHPNADRLQLCRVDVGEGEPRQIVCRAWNFRDGAPVDVRVEDLEGCPRYVGRLFREVRIGPSPAWLRARLHVAGMRPISNVVDATNYAMLALGNPLHAFDRAKLAEGRIVVRRARAGETIRTLDGSERRLEQRDLVIADAEKAVAIAGIMGSADSEVDDATTEVLLEAANFEPVGIMKSSERLGLRTEGSNRWEKGVDPHLAGQAAVLASELIAEHAGGRWVGETEVSADLPLPPVVRLRPERVGALVGLSIEPDEQRDILRRLAFAVDNDWNVTVPTWRARDVTREVDLAEEVVRIHGLERVPPTLPLRRYMRGRLTREQRLRRLLQDVLVGAWFSEACTAVPLSAEDDPEA